MIIIELEGKEYKMPSGWNEVNVGMFEKVMKHAGILSEYKSQVQYAIEMFSILTGAPVEDLNKMTRTSFEELSKSIEWVNHEVQPSNRKEWTFDGIDYMAVENLNKLTMGDTVSLELMINESNEENILSNILPILIRKVKEVKVSGGLTKKVHADFDADEYNELRKLFSENLMVDDVIDLKSVF